MNFNGLAIRGGTFFLQLPLPNIIAFHWNNNLNVEYFRGKTTKALIQKDIIYLYIIFFRFDFVRVLPNRQTKGQFLTTQDSLRICIKEDCIKSVTRLNYRVTNKKIMDIVKFSNLIKLSRLNVIHIENNYKELFSFPGVEMYCQ